jgi:acyl-coenzyme A synthetase/AMP-(fatty) acid ligase
MRFKRCDLEFGRYEFRVVTADIVTGYCHWSSNFTNLTVVCTPPIFPILTFYDETQFPVYEESVRTALYTLPTTIITANQLMTYIEKAAVCSEIRTKHSTQSEHQVEFLNV